jgi:hypothetical protein
VLTMKVFDDTMCRRHSHCDETQCAKASSLGFCWSLLCKTQVLVVLFKFPLQRKSFWRHVWGRGKERSSPKCGTKRRQPPNSRSGASAKRRLGDATGDVLISPLIPQSDQGATGGQPLMIDLKHCYNWISSARHVAGVVMSIPSHTSDRALGWAGKSPTAED